MDKKIVIGIALAGALGYCAYNLIGSMEYAKEEIQSTPSQERMDLLQLMDEIQVKGLEKLLQFLKSASMIGEQNNERVKKAMRKKLQHEMKQEYYRLEKEICQQNGWNITEYRHEIEERRNSNDTEITTRVNTLLNIFNSIIEDKKPKVFFTFNPILTEDLTLLLYKRILCSYLYLFCQELSKVTKDRKKLTEDSLAAIHKIANPIKEQCRAELIRCTGLSGTNNYYNQEFLKAIWTYRLNNNEFEVQIEQANKLYEKIMQSVTKDSVYTIIVDPCDMSVQEFDEYYESLRTEYVVRTVVSEMSPFIEVEIEGRKDLREVDFNTQDKSRSKDIKHELSPSIIKSEKIHE